MTIYNEFYRDDSPVGKGKRRAEREAEKKRKTLEDLKAHKGLSRYQRKKLEQKGIDINKAFGGPTP